MWEKEREWEKGRKGIGVRSEVEGEGVGEGRKRS